MMVILVWLSVVVAAEMEQDSTEAVESQVIESMVLVDDGEFWIDSHEVTNAEYARFVSATGHRVPSPVDTGIRGWNKWVKMKPPKGYEQHPVVGVDWWDATSYCDWAGKRLPLEREWERACRGLIAYALPWGEAPINRDRANYDPTGRSMHGTVAAGSLPEGSSPYGATEMVGNVWEWTRNKGVLRGGGWNNTDGLTRCSGRYRAMPASRDHAFGLRCVKRK